MSKIFTGLVNNKKMNSLLSMMMIASLVLLAIKPSEIEATVCNGTNGCYDTVDNCSGPCYTQCVTDGCYAASVCALSSYCSDSSRGVKCTCS